MTSGTNRLTEPRREKLNRLRERGINPYPNSYQRTHTTAQATALLKQMEEGSTQSLGVTVAGRLMARRIMGKGAFADIRDGSGKIQLLFQNINEYSEVKQELFKDIDIGDIVGVKGSVTRTRTGEPTVKVEEFIILSKSMQTLPEKWHGLSDTEKRYRQRYLDLIANTEIKAIFVTRSKIISAIRQFYDQRGFMEVETQMLQPSAGGALARPFITRHNALDQDFYLRIALELHLKRLIVGGIDKVYELGRVFRNEGIDTKHNPEFTMMESYEAYADYNDVMKMVEELVPFVSQQALGKTEVQYGEHVLNLAPPWQRISLREAVEKYSGIDFVKYNRVDSLRTKMQEMGLVVDPGKNWPKLVDELITTYIEPNLIQPTFLVDYPVSMSPLAKNKPGEERVVERFEAFIACMEVANAFSELNDPDQQRERFQQQMKEKHGEDEDVWTVDEDFLLALEHGMPPTGGLGIGIDRLVMLLTNQQSIREVVFFPQLKEKP
ncbi:lysine--tRNA ligase [Chloroflexota bacterium]